MYVITIDIRDIVYFLAMEIEKVYPYGFDVDENKVWEVFDDCFVEKQLQSFRDTELYDGYKENVCTDRLDYIFEQLFKGVNNFLDFRVRSDFRFTLPDTVIYLGACKFKLYWRSKDECLSS